MSSVKPNHILGMNARTQVYTALNSREAKRYGFSKLRAKNFLKKHGIQVPELFASISSREELRSFDWLSVKGSFAVKPGNGSAGKGIIVIQKYLRKQAVWVDVEGNEYSETDLDLHVGDILDGRYTTWGTKHSAIIEERILIHPDLEPHVEMGTPDVRIILFHKIPVMAMVRLPTEESDGKANLDQGAIGCGIDLGTGKTTFAVSGKKKIIKNIPKSGISSNGIQIPYWKQALKASVRVANATGYVYMGVDIFLDPEKGPVIAEVNGFPGLSVQLANRAGLRRRLERVEGIEARNVNHAVKIAQSLFAESFPAADIDLVIIEPREEVVVYGDDKKSEAVRSQINTGRFRSAISLELAQRLGLVDDDDLLWRQNVEEEGRVPVVEVKFKLKDRVITTTMTVSKRLKSKSYEVEIGRKDLSGFLIASEERS